MRKVTTLRLPIWREPVRRRPDKKRADDTSREAGPCMRSHAKRFCAMTCATYREVWQNEPSSACALFAESAARIERHRSILTQ